ncbi:hypothetical protein [Ensifer sp. 1H6]|uniref:hypothetical protein n=1 Tax=Ensifer sp. 1H6 TaxID=1911585 RepID=UPI0009D57741|nr:hypothetical protein [Ensifer sp. 1H6]MDP9632420.1 hypothetical protein [Ensifer adhaerens]OMQ39866.1 hypothetical protein BKP54_30650 [Ensifer sp. 1H6]
MTDIRKHGFDSDMQWREYLAEIEEAAVANSPSEPLEPNVTQELADLRRQVAALRERVVASIRHQRSGRPWWVIGAGALLLVLMTTLRLAKVSRP